MMSSGAGSEHKVAVSYTAEFIDGPLDGQTDTRVLVRGEFSPRISMVAAVDGMESLFWYDAVDERDVQGRLHVRYRFDAGDSDPVD
jgi:hypothetical protein